MTAMRLKRYPSPSGGFALGKMGVGATMLKQGKTARDYVCNLALWDMVENAGWGVHSDGTSTSWTDLIQGATLSYSSWRMRGDLGKFIWGANRVLNFDKLTLAQSVLNGLTTGGDFTIEAVCGDPPSTGNEAIIVGIADSSTFYGQGSTFARGGASGIGLRSNTYGAKYPSPAVVETLSTGVFATYACKSENGVIYGYRNGERLNVSLTADTGKGFASLILQRAYAYKGIRIDSRALSDSVIARNYAIDQESFNMP